MTPLCHTCRPDGQIRRHRHCGWCGRPVWGSDERYIEHAWICPGPQEAGAF